MHAAIHGIIDSWSGAAKQGNGQEEGKSFLSYHSSDYLEENKAVKFAAKDCRSGFAEARFLLLNLPNSITFSRLALTGVFIGAVTVGGTAAYVVGLIAFVLATISDWLDGYLARKLDLVTSLGKLMDPLADKVLVASAFVFFSSAGLCPVWVTAVIIGREFLVTGLRQIAVEKGVVMAADRLGKWKTTFQLAFGITCMIRLIEADWNVLHGLSEILQPIFLWVSLALTVLSGVNYLLKSKELLTD